MILYRQSCLIFGKYAIKVLEFMRITAKQLEFLRREVNRFFKRKVRIWLRVFPNVPVTAKKDQSRMGKGVGALVCWVAYVYPGQILLEFTNINFLDCVGLVTKCQKFFAVRVGLFTI